MYATNRKNFIKRKKRNKYKAKDTKKLYYGENDWESIVKFHNGVCSCHQTCELYNALERL